MRLRAKNKLHALSFTVLSSVGGWQPIALKGDNLMTMLGQMPIFFSFYIQNNKNKIIIKSGDYHWQSVIPKFIWLYPFNQLLSALYGGENRPISSSVGSQHLFLMGSTSPVFDLFLPCGITGPQTFWSSRSCTIWSPPITALSTHNIWIILRNFSYVLKRYASGWKDYMLEAEKHHRLFLFPWNVKLPAHVKGEWSF